MTQLQFLGANRQVTGSSYLLTAGGLRILIDCGLFQERAFQHLNWEPFSYDPASIDLMLLTHGHLDHCGLIPKLVRDGFSKPIYTTGPSVAIARIIMLDSGKLQEEDAAFKRKRHQQEGRDGPRPVVPLYTKADAERAVPLLRGVDYNRPLKLNEQVSVTWHDAGHILGSAMLEVIVRENGSEKRIVFSGDIGQPDRPLLKDPTHLKRADAVIVESTYGDREHADDGDVQLRLADVINEAHRAGGNVIIPTFAVERAQELLYHMANLVRRKLIPPMPVFLDSPMAVQVGELFQQFTHLLDDDTRKLIDAGRDPLDFPGLNLARTTSQSQAINAIRGTAVIMAGSGMCTGGRIKHHLKFNISRPESTILFVGYQSPGTLGREILDGINPVRLFGRETPVRARITRISGLSAHADRSGLLNWLAAFDPKPAQLFLTHGEEKVAIAFARTIDQQLGITATIPEYQQTVPL